ncbi:hypothetical protein LCGC14_3007520 [marine sediment metagenome]|uniref:Nucleotidyl transferase domain-containing protein n=1 Tax=marine sediment metagenome TaxID=412755 RepID=A0A0F8Z6V3_9ZZZZ
MSAKFGFLKTPVDGVILAAGGGTRMRPLSYEISKPMLPICNKPLLALLAERMDEIGMKSIIIIDSPSNFNFIKNYFKIHPLTRNTPITYAIQKEALGTAHALLQAKDYIKCEFIFAMAGDNYFSSETIFNLINHHLQDVPEVTIALKKVTSKEIITLSSVLINKRRLIQKIVEKPSKDEILSLLAATSAYTFDSSFFNILSEIPISIRGEYEIPTAFEVILKKNGSIKGIETPDWDHISTPDDLWRFNMIMCESSDFDTTAIISPSSTIVHSIIGYKSLIGNNCKIDNCLILPKTVIKDKQKFRNSILYSNSNNDLEIYQISEDYIKKYQITI